MPKKKQEKETECCKSSYIASESGNYICNRCNEPCDLQIHKDKENVIIAEIICNHFYRFGAKISKKDRDYVVVLLNKFRHQAVKGFAENVKKEIIGGTLDVDYINFVIDQEIRSYKIEI